MIFFLVCSAENCFSPVPFAAFSFFQAGLHDQKGSDTAGHGEYHQNDHDLLCLSAVLCIVRGLRLRRSGLRCGSFSRRCRNRPETAQQKQCSQQNAKASFPTLPHGFSPVWTALSQRHCCAVVFQICVILDDLDVVVNVHTSTSRNQLTDNNIFLQTIQIVALATDCGIGQRLCGLLEGCSRQEAVGAGGCLGNTWSIGSTVTRETSVSPLSMRSWSASLTSMILRRSTIVPGSR